MSKSRIEPPADYNPDHWTPEQREQYLESRRYQWPPKQEVEHLRGADGLVHWPKGEDAGDPWKALGYLTGLTPKECVLEWLQAEFGAPR